MTGHSDWRLLVYLQCVFFLRNFLCVKAVKNSKAYYNNKFKVENYTTTGLFYTIFLSLHKREAFLKPRVDACFHQLKMAATLEEFGTHGFNM